VLAAHGHVTGYDLSPASIEKAAMAFPDLKFEACDIMVDPPSGEYGLVVSSEVIEHIEDQQRFADNLIAATAPGGLIVITTPNARLKDHWVQSRGFKPQPLENWLTVDQVANLFAGCERVEHGTFYFNTGLAPFGTRPSLAAAKRSKRVQRFLSKREAGLYQIGVFRKR
jgi:2-polyprenyl-3-methyl-5-hydroxy-6-metoxy-1,4-benzoquinol methylase